MDFHLIILVLESVTWLGMFAIATYLLIPKAVHAWERWEKTKKTIHLSHAIGSMVLAVLAYSMDFVFIIIKLVKSALLS